MPKIPGPRPGPKPSAPPRGSSGPNDKGGGTRHRAHPYLPPADKGGRLTGTGTNKVGGGKSG